MKIYTTTAKTQAAGVEPKNVTVVKGTFEPVCGQVIQQKCSIRVLVCSEERFALN